MQSRNQTAGSQGPDYVDRHAQPLCVLLRNCNAGFPKLIFAIDTRRLLGAHILGEGPTELIHIGQAAINLKGTVEFIVENAFNNPTLAEAYKAADLDAWNRMGQA
jgi:NAD(P) transhydrogenase